MHILTATLRAALTIPISTASLRCSSIAQTAQLYATPLSSEGTL